MKLRNAIDYYNSFAKKYDSLSKKHEWNSPEVLFGLIFESVKKREKLLDLGIGTGLSAIPFKQIGLKIYGVDGSKKMLKICKTKRIAEELKEFDLSNTPFPYEGEDFDHIIANGLLYFFKNLEHFFSEAKRILKNGGTFSFNVEDNKDKNLISERLIKKANVKVYSHSTKYINKLIKKFNFVLLKKLDFFAYYSPTENKNIYFKVYVTKKF